MSGPPEVSLTLPVLNGETYLAEAIESVLAQTFSSWELLVVDDGSTDGTADLLRRYSERRPDQVRALQHPGGENRGMMASRSLGLRHSRGRFIARLDADDVLRPTAFQDQVELLNRHPDAAMTYGPVEMWRSWAGPQAKGDKFQPLTVARNTPLPPPQVLRAFLTDGRDEPVGMFVRKDVVERVGGFSVQGLHGDLYEDIALNVKICLRHPVIAADRSWYRYRQHDASYCSVVRRKDEFELGQLRFLEWVDAYLAREAPADPDLRQILAASLERQRALVRR